jgi:hypothetical protein
MNFENTTVILKKDITDKDMYGRLLRDVRTIEGVSINQMLVENGYAVIKKYPPDINFCDDIGISSSKKYTKVTTDSTGDSRTNAIIQNQSTQKNSEELIISKEKIFEIKDEKYYSPPRIKNLFISKSYIIWNFDNNIYSYNIASKEISIENLEPYQATTPNTILWLYNDKIIFQHDGDYIYDITKKQKKRVLCGGGGYLSLLNEFLLCSYNQPGSSGIAYINLNDLDSHSERVESVLDFKNPLNLNNGYYVIESPGSHVRPIICDSKTKCESSKLNNIPLASIKYPYDRSINLEVAIGSWDIPCYGPYGPTSEKCRGIINADLDSTYLMYDWKKAQSDEDISEVIISPPKLFDYNCHRYRFFHKNYALFSINEYRYSAFSRAWVCGNEFWMENNSVVKNGEYYLFDLNTGVYEKIVDDDGQFEHAFYENLLVYTNWNNSIYLLEIKQ